LQWALDRIKLGSILPLQSLYVLRGDFELWEAIGDLSFSLLGMFSNPLWFSFHLKGLLKMPAATIVVDSIVTNYARLLTTVVLALCMIYLFALCGLLYFFDAHTGSNVANKGYLGDSDPLANEYAGGPCSNLMSCMVSYSFAGFLQQGLTYWLEEPRFPETLTDLLENDSGRILFEVMFMIVTSSFVISIITGIICDTFGELRTAQDEAINYRATTCFVTSLPFSTVPDQKSTHYIQYAYLMLYLERKEPEECTPIERQIKTQIELGQVDWLPDGACLELLRQRRDTGLVLPRLDSIEMRMEKMEDLLVKLASAVPDVA